MHKKKGYIELNGVGDSNHNSPYKEDRTMPLLTYPSNSFEPTISLSQGELMSFKIKLICNY